MANYANLKSAIQEVIRTNGNEEITGALLQQSLIAMINALGGYYQFAGIATPSTNPGTPDQNVFYLASTAGTYSNFGSIVITKNEAAILKYNGTWSKDSSGFATSEKVNQLDQELTGIQTTENAEVYQVFPSSATDTPDGTRLRLLFQINKGERVSAETTEGRGLSVDIYETKEAALINGNSNNLQAFTNRQYAASASGTANYDGVLVVSLCKNDSTAFSAAEKSIFVSATIVRIESDTALIPAVTQLSETALNSYFDGLGSTYSCRYIYGLIPNHIYKLSIRNSSPWYDISTVEAATDAILNIYNSYNGVATAILRIEKQQIAGGVVVNPYYIFKVPSDSDFISVGGRAPVGTRIRFIIEDVTDYGFVIDSPYDADYVLRKVPSNGDITDDATGTRLRIVLRVSKGMRFCVSSLEKISVSLYNNINAAIFASRYYIETYTNYAYSVEAAGITISDGFLSISMTNGSTPIDSSRKAEMLDSLYFRVGIGAVYESSINESFLNRTISVLNSDMGDALVSVGGVNSYKSGGYQSPVGEKKNLSIMAITDVHGTFDAISRAVKFANEKTDFIDYVVCLGDIVLRSPADSITDFENSFANCVKPFLFTVGNHDTADTGLAAITESQARTKYFTQIVSKGWISNFKDANSCSWYKDDSTHKIRFISVFEYGNSQTVSSGAPNTYCRRWIPTDTLQWFADILYSTPSDYSVVVLLHQIPFFPATYIEGKFTISSDMRISLSQFFLNTVDGNPFGDIVDAFINGTNLSKTYNSIQSYGLGKTATVAKDFTGRGVGKFICFVVGHFHGSYIFKDATYPAQITVAVPSGSRSSFQQQYGDTNYVPDTRNQDQFYIIGFDTVKKLINIAKIGGQVTNDMVKRDIISIKY